MENRGCSPAVLCAGVLTGGVSIYGGQVLLSTCPAPGFSLGASLFMEDRRCSPAVMCGVLTGGVSIYGGQALLSTCPAPGFSLGASLFMENRRCSPPVLLRGSHWGRLY